MELEGFIQDPATKQPSGFNGIRRAGPGIQRSLSTLGCLCLASQHSSRRGYTYAGTLQSSSRRSYIALTGSRWNIAWEPLPCTRAEEYGGNYSRVCTKNECRNCFLAKMRTTPFLISKHAWGLFSKIHRYQKRQSLPRTLCRLATTHSCLRKH